MVASFCAGCLLMTLAPYCVRDAESRVAKADVEWYPLPADFEVVGGDGEIISPSPGRQFFVTVETFNPFHGLCEAEPWP